MQEKHSKHELHRYFNFCYRHCGITGISRSRRPAEEAEYLLCIHSTTSPITATRIVTIRIQETHIATFHNPERYEKCQQTPAPSAVLYLLNEWSLIRTFMSGLYKSSSVQSLVHSSIRHLHKSQSGLLIGNNSSPSEFAGMRPWLFTKFTKGQRPNIHIINSTPL